MFPTLVHCCTVQAMCYALHPINCENMSYVSNGLDSHVPSFFKGGITLHIYLKLKRCTSVDPYAGNHLSFDFPVKASAQYQNHVQFSAGVVSVCLVPVMTWASQMIDLGQVPIGK